MSKNDDLGFIADDPHELGFEPDHVDEEVKSEISPTQTFAESAANSVLFGAKPIVAGASQSAMDALTGVIAPQDILERYRHYRDAEAKKQQEIEAENPKSAIAGTVAGGILPALATGGASTEATVGNTARMGALYGGISGAATSKGDLTKGEVLPVAENAIEGAGAGGLLGGLLGTIGKKLAPEALEKTAAEHTLPSLGYKSKDIQQLRDKDRLIQEYKNLTTPNKYSKEPVQSVFGGVEGKLDKAEAALEQSGKDVNDLLKTFDQIGMASEVPPQQFPSKDTIKTQLQELQKATLVDGKQTSTGSGTYNKIQGLIDDLDLVTQDNLSFTQSNKLKQLIKNEAYSPNGTVKDPDMARAYGILNQEIEESADKISASIKDPDLQNAYQQAKDKYSTYLKADARLSGLYGKEVAGSKLGMADIVPSIAGAAHGSPIAGITAGKLLKGYGGAMVGKGAQVAADTSKVINKILTGSKESTKAFGQQLVTSNDEIISKLGNILIQAAEKDDTGRNALLFSAMQNPAYREALHSVIPNENK